MDDSVATSAFFDSVCNYTQFDNFVDTGISCRVGSDGSDNSREDCIYLDANAEGTSLSCEINSHPVTGHGVQQGIRTVSN